jgi:HEAT repeat protein
LDGLAQVEAARLVAELAKDEHFNQVFQYARQFFKEFQEARRLQKEIEELAGTEKAERLGQLMTFGQEWFESTHQGLWQTYIEKARTGEQSEAEALKEKLIDPKNRAHGFYVQYGALMVQNKMALASKYLEESSGMAKAVWARKRQVLSQFALALGRTAAHLQDHSDNRAQVTAFFESLFKLSNPDIERFVLFGLAPYLTPEESQLFPYIIASARVEGLTRLLKSLGKTKNPGFIPFFLRLASEHQLVDIQEMAMQGLSALPQVHDELRQMLNSKEQSQIRTAIRVIGNIQADELASSIIEMLPNSSDFLKMDIIVALGRLRNEVHLPLIQKILEDAKTPNLVTTCLNALGEMKTTAAVTHLRRFAETAQNRQSALVALDHYVRYFYRWDDPLPGDAHESVVRLVHEFGSDRQKEMRIKACQIASRVITWDLSLYQDLRNFFKDRNTVLRKQSNWDRAEMEQVEKSQKSLNRSFYFLKDALEQQERFETSLRKLATFQGGRWIEEAERLVALLEKAEFPLSPDFLGELNQVVKQQLPEKESWREWKCLFKLAGITKQPDLIPLLHTYIKRVPTQARDTLHDALVQLGKSLKEIEKATQIQSVIVLEASNFFRKKLVQFLEGLGLEAVGCETLSEVEKELQRAPRDCMITELTQVQQADLLDDLLRLKSHIKAPMEWILSTNCRDPQTLRKAITLQPKKVLLKPYSFEDLKAQLRP